MTLFSLKHIELENARIYFRDMSYLRESLNNLLGPNVIGSYKSYKKGRREQPNHKPIKCLCRHLPTLAPQKRKHIALQTIFTEI